MRRQHRFLTAIAAAAAAALALRAGAVDVAWNVATGDYNSGGNWVGGNVPSVTFDEVALIANGGTAQLAAAGADTPGGVRIATASGTSGTLELSVVGNLSVVDAGGDGVGQVAVGSTSGGGTLRVRPGATLTAAGVLSSAASAGNRIELGGAAAGAATVAVGAANFGGTTTVARNVVFTATTGTAAGANGSITLGATSVYSPTVTATGVALLTGDGGVALDGTLKPIFTGVSPANGQTWDLFQGAGVSGAFAAIETANSGLGPGQKLIVKTANPSPGVFRAQMQVDQQLSLLVNRDTGVISLNNPGAAALSLDGYDVQSASGKLSHAAWAAGNLDATNALGGDWLAAASSTNNRLAELKPTSSGTLAGASSRSLGAAFAPSQAPAAQFGDPTDDLTFRYSKPDGTLITGDVIYAGITGINNIVLQIDPTDGKARIRNTSAFAQNIDGYDILSPSASLSRTLWSSLDDQNTAGGDWAETTPGGSPTSTQLGELKPTSSTLLGTGTTFNLGNPFVVGGMRDLTFQFVLAGESTPLTGVVVYEAFTVGAAIDADFNNDGLVDGADVLRLQRNLGLAAGGSNAQGDTDGNGAINGVDFDNFRSRFGQPMAAPAVGAVPEPAGWLLLALAGGAAARRRLIQKCHLSCFDLH